MTDKLTKLEKTTLALLGAGNAFNVLVFGLGVKLSAITPDAGPLWGWRVVFAWLAFLAFDLTAVVTIMGFRDGRRGAWAELAALGAMLSGILIAVDVAYGAGWAWLHAMPIVVLYLFGRHLATPRVGTRAADYQRATAQAEQRAAQAEAQVADLGARVAHAEAEAARAWADAGTNAVEAGAEIARARERVAQLDRELAQARRELARRPQEDGAAWLVYNGQRVTLAQLVEATGTSSSTLRRKLARLAETTAQAAD